MTAAATIMNGESARAHKPFATYPGSKDASGCAERIVRLFPAHSVYVEAFLGGGAVLRRKTPALRTIGIDSDGEVIARWRGVGWPGLELIEADAIEWLDSYGRCLPTDALVYCDPPYMHETRSHRRLYRHELSGEQHARLLDVLDALPCSVIISGYETDLYLTRLAAWRHEEFPAMTRGGVRTEHVWYRHSLASFTIGWSRIAGTDYRERERIKRKAHRWAERYRRMPREERAFVLATLLEIDHANQDQTRTLEG